MRPRDEEPAVDVSVLAAADPAQPYGAGLAWPKRAARAARVAGAYVVLIGGEAVLFVERGGKTLVPLRDPDPDWLRPALGALVEHVKSRRGTSGWPSSGSTASRWGDGRDAALVEAGFVAVHAAPCCGRSRYHRQNLDRTSPYRLGFAVKVLGNGGMKSHDARRWQSGPHLSRSLELLDAVFDYLDDVDIRVYRMSSSTVPYGTHPDLPQLDYRRQIGECEAELARLGRRRAASVSGSPPIRASTRCSAPRSRDREKARLDVEQDALLLDALGTGPEAVVVIHVGGVYGDARASLDRWVRLFEALSEAARPARRRA